MNDRIPGSAYHNPIWYKGYRIFVSDCEYVNYEFVHDDYDGAPDANDNRCGYGQTIENCKDQIDEIEDR